MRDLQLADAVPIPLGTKLGFEPRMGAGIFLGGGFGLPSWTLGAGLVARLTPGFGLRTYHRLIGTGYNYGSISALYLGVVAIR